MDHCGLSGGQYGVAPGAYVIDFLSYLARWVEEKKAPDVMIGAHLKDTDTTRVTFSGLSTQFPLDPAAVAFTRPVYPYPLNAKYLGKGDPNDAANFGPVKP
jgi:feruloyl esterase